MSELKLRPPVAVALVMAELNGRKDVNPEGVS